VSAYVHVAARRALDARRARAETEALAASAGALASTGDAVPALLEQIVTTFGCRSAELRPASGGDGQPGEPDATVITVTDTVDLVLHGPPLSLDDRVALRSHADQLAVAVRDRALQEDAARAVVAREADELRTALLRAVSHDLRTPLAGIKASVTSLLSTDVVWKAEQRDEFLQTIDSETDRLNRLVGNLLDMSRLQAGVVHLQRTPATVDDVVAATLASLSAGADAVRVEVPDDLPLIDVDPELLERALANVLANAITWSPPGAPVALQAAAVGDRLHLRVVDRGPGIDEAARRSAVQPFQRLGDSTNTQSPNGVGLGLAVARGFLLAMGGELVLDDTPGGGLTVVLEVPVAADGSTAPAPPTSAFAS
jgi:two-component system sensor histidine kinase KdpD